jgi:hypothetical protein
MQRFRKIGVLGIIFLAMILVAMFLSSCSRDQESERAETEKRFSPDQEAGFSDSAIAQPGYEDWHEYFDEFLVVYCPPDSELIARVPAISKRIKEVMIENAVRLKVNVPTPSIFFLYHNTTEIQERTDCDNSCVRGNIFHYMIYTPLGEQIMVRLLQDFDPDGCPYQYCYEGLVTYLNYSGENYVEKGYIHMFNETLPELSELIDNEKYLALDTALRTEVSASLAEYLLAPPNSPDKFLTLFKRNDASPADALAAVFEMTVEELEQGWHEYLSEHSGIKMEY